MLATSSSDEDEYDQKRRVTHQSNLKSSGAPPAQSASFLSAQQKTGSTYSQPSTPNMAHTRSPMLANNLNPTVNAMSNLNLANGDTNSLRSSFSASSENLSLNNFQQQQINKANNKANNSFRNASFKSNSSASTVGGATLTPNHMHTPRASPRKHSARSNNNGRQLPRRPGDSTSYSSSLNDRNEDSDNSDYNINNNANEASYQTMNQQNSDDENFLEGKCICF